MLQVKDDGDSENRTYITQPASKVCLKKVWFFCLVNLLILIRRICMLKLFQPAPPIERLPNEQIDSEYKKHRIQVFIGIFMAMQRIIYFAKTSLLRCPINRPRFFQRRAEVLLYPLFPSLMELVNL